MATPVNCPNCGSTLAPGVMACARCGHKLTVEPASEPAPVAGPQFPRPATAAPPPPASLNVQQMLADIRARWGIQQTPYFVGVMALAVLALLIGTIAHISYLTAGATEANKQLDDGVWLTTATALALAAAVLALVVRREAGIPPRASDVRNPDFRVALGLAGTTILFAFVGVIIGMSGRFDAALSWERYAEIFAFFALGWLIISRPVPEALGTVNSITVGFIAGGAILVALVIGQIMGLSHSNDSYTGGISWQALAISALVLELGWFLGMRPKGE
ncbi:MAG TPA: zinc ribbon domain-containing protein [Dehalococcoidia bacterium]|jgi:lysylphosphatidylglycerol synthetase-like protein (DUF2156 family)